MTPKFKVGDRVVTTTKEPFADYPIHSKAEIIEIDLDETFISLEMEDGHTQECYEDCIELEQIYNSPLYKALR